jgi:hypothetical protein
MRKIVFSEKNMPNDKRTHLLRRVNVIVCILLIYLALVCVIAASPKFLTALPSVVQTFLALIFVMSPIVGLILILGRPDVDESLEISELRTERKVIEEKIETNKDVDIFENIQLNLNHLNEYYIINKGQAKRSFTFSLIAIVMGLLTILTGIGLFYIGKSNITTTIVTSISGILLEFIGGAYFFLYKKSIEQVNLFFGQLIKVQDTMLSINMARGIDDKDKRIGIEEKIILSLLERSLK